MKDLEEIIHFENENTCLDFKAIEYTRDKFEAFLKDVVSLANAKSEEDKYIIIGVKPQPDGNRSLLGIENITDESSYQQLVNENIEPEINLKYFSFTCKEKQFGIFQIYDCKNQPYMLKKDFKNLKKGDGFIRKGSHQTRLTRQDIDYFYNKKYAIKAFQVSLDIYFNVDGVKSQPAHISIAEDIRLPSKKAAGKIQKILDKREREKGTMLYNPLLYSHDFVDAFGNSPFERRSSNTLRKNLEEIKEIYMADDLYYIFEKKASKLNIEVLNLGETYIEDASIEIRVAKNENYIISTEVHGKPGSNNSYGGLINIPESTSWERIKYPNVSILDEEYVFFEGLGDIKHNIPKKVFTVPIRIIVHQKIKNQDIFFKIKIFSKNIPSCFEKELTLTIAE